MSEFKVGDKVRVTTQDNDHVSTISFVDENKVYPYKLSVPNGDWINAYRDGELELVTTKEEKKPMERRTFKQLKDTVDTKKGALWQENCDDGTQGFSLISEEHVKHGEFSDYGDEFYTRDAVITQSDWFVEVFKVTPEYMTENELNKWNEFNKKPVTRKYTMSAKAIKSRKENAAKRRKTTSRGKSNV